MEWMNSNMQEIEAQNISNKEQKEKIAKEVALKAKDGDVIGFGSGSTSYLAAKEIAKRMEEELRETEELLAELERERLERLKQG